MSNPGGLDKAGRERQRAAQREAALREEGQSRAVGGIEEEDAPGVIWGRVCVRDARGGSRRAIRFGGMRSLSAGCKAAEK